MERTRTYSYKVAGLTFSVIAPVGIDIEALLPSFKDFRATSGEMSAPEPHREMPAPEPHRELCSASHYRRTPLRFRQMPRKSKRMTTTWDTPGF